MPRETPTKPGKWPFFILALGVISLLGGGTWLGLGGLLVVVGAVPLIMRQVANRRANSEALETARQATLAQAAREAERKRLGDEEERRFHAEQAEMKEKSTYRLLHAQLDELINYANRLRADGDNRQVIVSMMEAVGQLAGNRELEDRFFREPGIADDIQLFFQQMNRMNMQDEIVYQRAKRVLRHDQVAASG